MVSELALPQQSRAAALACFHAKEQLRRNQQQGLSQK
jgi:hypothetical protein